MTQPYQDKNQQGIRDDQKTKKDGMEKKQQHGFHKPQDSTQKGKDFGNEEHMQRNDRNKPTR